jgi:hypothetical protein
MFWSKKSSTVAIMAGRKAAHLAQTGKSNIGTSQGLPDVVAKVVGSDKAGSPATADPRDIRAHLAISDATTTDIVGAKFATVLRIRLEK